MTNWKEILLRWLDSHPATADEINLVEEKCGIKITNDAPVLVAGLTADSQGKSERRRIHIYLRNRETTGSLHSMVHRSSDQGVNIDGQLNQAPVSEDGEFVVLDDNVCLLIDIWRGNFHMIPWEEIIYIKA